MGNFLPAIQSVSSFPPQRLIAAPLTIGFDTTEPSSAMQSTIYSCSIQTCLHRTHRVWRMSPARGSRGR